MEDAGLCGDAPDAASRCRAWLGVRDDTPAGPGQVAEIARAVATRRAAEHPDPDHATRCDRLRAARRLVHAHAGQAARTEPWPRQPTAFDLVGVRTGADGDLVRRAAVGRLADLHGTHVGIAREQVAWAMARCGFNAEWTGQRGTLNRESVLARLPAFGVPSRSGATLHSVAVVWAVLMLDDPEERARHLASLPRPRPCAHPLPRPTAPASAPPAPDRATARALVGDLVWRGGTPASWRDAIAGPGPAAATDGAPATEPPTREDPATSDRQSSGPCACGSQTCDHDPSGPAALAEARRILCLSVLASPGVVLRAADELLARVHIRLSSAALAAGRAYGDVCERLDTAERTLLGGRPTAVSARTP